MADSPFSPTESSRRREKMRKRDEDEESFISAHSATSSEAALLNHPTTEKFGGLHYLPLVFACIPPLGATIHGEAASWNDVLILLLLCFYLYQIVRVPWELYYASRTRRINQAALLSTPTEHKDSPEVIRKKRDAATELVYLEMVSLAMTVASPLIGAWLLYFMRSALSQPERFINPFSVRLFVLASGVKPWSHLFNLLTTRSLFLQEEVHFPSDQVQRISRKVEKLEHELATLRKAFATKTEVRQLREGLDAPLSQLHKAVNRHARKEEFLRLSAEEKFNLVDQRLEDVLREVQINADLVDQIKEEQDKGSRSAMAALLSALLHPRSHPQALTPKNRRWYERSVCFYIFFPLNVTNSLLRIAGDAVDSALAVNYDNRAALIEHKKIHSN